MSSSSKNKLLTTILTANIPGCDCGRLKLSNVYKPTPKPKIQIHKNPIHRSHSSSSSGDQNGKSFTVDDDEDQCSSTIVPFNNNSSSQSKPFDSADSTNPKNTTISSPNTTKTSGSIAVVKESKDPYQDFRQSMLQMIVEQQIYSKEDLQELLHCFLELNSPSHHDVIIRAFTQIWNDLIRESKKPMIMNPRWAPRSNV